MNELVCPNCGSKSIEVSAIRVYSIVGLRANDKNETLHDALFGQDIDFEWVVESFYCVDCEWEGEDAVYDGQYIGGEL